MKGKRHRDGNSRREFFKKAALIGAAALLGGKARRAPANGDIPAPLPSTESRYRTTAHIRRYYERASV